MKISWRNAVKAWIAGEGITRDAADNQVRYDRYQIGPYVGIETPRPSAPKNVTDVHVRVFPNKEFDISTFDWIDGLRIRANGGQSRAIMTLAAFESVVNYTRNHLTKYIENVPSRKIGTDSIRRRRVKA
jgi:hypothetical protein